LFHKDLPNLVFSNIGGDHKVSEGSPMETPLLALGEKKGTGRKKELEHKKRA
jgi:hypothetical protein